MAAKYASVNIYNYGFNNPVMFNDPTGADGKYSGDLGGFIGYPDPPEFMFGPPPMFDNDEFYKMWNGVASNAICPSCPNGGGNPYVVAVCPSCPQDDPRFSFFINDPNNFWTYDPATGQVSFYAAILYNDRQDEDNKNSQSDQQNNSFKWEDADNVGDMTSAMMAGPALAGANAEYEIANKLVKNAQKGYYDEAIKSVTKYNKVVGGIGKVLGVTGVVTSFGELVTEEFSWTNLTKFAINVGSLALKANPVGATVSLVVGVADATGLLDKGLNYIYGENTSQ